MANSFSFRDLNTGVIKKGSTFTRVFNHKYSSVSTPPIDFSDMRRFSPISIQTEGDLQGFYFRDSVSTCIRESVLRKSNSKLLMPDDLLSKSACEIEILSDMPVAMLDRDWLMKVLRKDVVSLNDYPQCAMVAKIILRQDKDLSGFIFRSYQKNGEGNNWVLFQPRMLLENIREVSGTADHLVSKRYGTELVMECKSFGAKIPYVIKLKLKDFGIIIK